MPMRLFRLPIRRALLALALLSAGASVAHAQVGHLPGDSPYQDLIQRQSFTPIFGSFGGNGGKLGIGPHSGTTYGLRYDIRVSNPVQFGFGLSTGNFDRLIVDADDSVATRVKGPVSQSVTLIGLTLQWNLTGAKTWHNLAPYWSGGLGIAIAGKTVADTSGYSFGKKFYLTPAFGVRYFPTRRLHLRLEAGQVFWKLKYPTAYLDQPADQPGTTTSNAVITDGKIDQWTGGRWLVAGLGYSF